jgi:outer membrane immunogenic protein
MRAPKTRTVLAGVAALAFSIASAFAADVPVKAPVLKATAAVYNWTGWYGGYNTGVGVSQTIGRRDGNAGSFDAGGAGVAGGVQGGYNWQLAPQWVGGFEGDVGYLRIDRSFLEFDNNSIVGLRTGWYGTVRGRLGFTNGPSLFYATGGVALVNVRNNFDAVGETSTIEFASSRTAIGWTVGGGIETMLGGNWSMKAEYLFINADQNTFISNLDRTAHFDNRFHVFRYGLNYKSGDPEMPVAALPSHDWTGFYAGVNAGAGLSQVKTNATSVAGEFAGAVDIAGSGFTGGVQAGYNWQLAPNWVAGTEAEIGFLGVDRSFADFDDGPIRFGIKTDWYGTLRGRLGYSTGPALVYVTGGAAFLNLRNDSTRDIDNLIPTSISKTAAAWTIGGGIEAALAQNWTAKTEYLYFDAGSQTLVVASVNFGDPTARFNNRFHVFRFGLNYRFGS